MPTKNVITPTTYQRLAARTLGSRDEPLSNQEVMILWNAVGIAGEAGEIVDYIKKGVFHDHGVAPEKVAEELGDLMWYIAGLATVMGFSLEDVMIQNISKLKKRYPEGFSSEDSLARRDREEG